GQLPAAHERPGERRRADLVSESGGLEQRPHHAGGGGDADRRGRQCRGRHRRGRRHRGAGPALRRRSAHRLRVTPLGRQSRVTERGALSWPEPLPQPPPPPYLGRSARIVGPVANVDMNQTPHPKNSRGELGKALFNWYRNTISRDPLTRVSAPNHFADQRNFLAAVANQAPKGTINSKQVVAVSDPAAMT